MKKWKLLAVCRIIESSLFDKPVDNKIVIVGEVGLGGEIRSVNNIEKRIQEAEKLGFETMILPENNLKGLNKTNKIVLTPVGDLSSTLKILFT